jgi:EpsI family protein
MTARMLVVGAMLMLSAWAVRAVGHGEPVELRQPFSQFPDRLDTWQGENLRFSARIEDKLGVTDYVSKVYRAGSNRSAHLYVGFYSSQRHGEMIHSPKNCLPGNGWYIAKRDTAIVNVSPYLPFTVNSYIVENGIDRQLVLYWYQQSGGRIVTNEYLGRVHLVFDSLTKNRSDAALIRVSVPLGEDSATAVRTALDFLQTAYPAVMRFLPHDIASSGSRITGG